MTSPSAVILLSGGLDSATNLALAARAGKAALALTIAYGQRTESMELQAAERLCQHYDVPWRSLSIPWLGQIDDANALTNKALSLPQLQIQDLDRSDITQKSMANVWVANRNGLFINIAATFAEARGWNEIIVGFNREEASTFPDNSAAYLAAANAALAYSTRNQAKVYSYTLEWDKTEIMAQARALKMPLDIVWSCYEAGPRACGKCESCQRFARAKGKL